MTENKRRERRFFSEEYKREAVELIDKIGISKVEKELGIGKSTLRAWKRKLKSPSVESKESTQGKKTYQELERENRRLEKEIGYLKEINKVLKKSTAIFSNDHLGSLK